MVLGYSLLRAYVAEHIQLLLVFSTHTSFLSGCAVETRAFRGTESASNRVFPQPARQFRGIRRCIDSRNLQLRGELGLQQCSAAERVRKLEPIRNWLQHIVQAKCPNRCIDKDADARQSVRESRPSLREASRRAEFRQRNWPQTCPCHRAD